MSKTPAAVTRAIQAYIKRNGFINYSRRIKPEWKQILDDALNKLRKNHQD